ncbi:MAG: peptidoglycan DD-metalloendopeptidase family protein [Firmicutes bacterium]|nr:peptidoglycan DD-metalloendopeptidase family protein [Bacillota bacterium]
MYRRSGRNRGSSAFFPVVLYILVAACVGFGAGLAVPMNPRLAEPPVEPAILGPEEALAPPALPGETPDAPRAPEPESRESEPSAAPELLHRVRPGETLWHLARVYNTTPLELARLNGLPDVNKVRAGSNLRIPGATGAISSASQVEATSARLPAMSAPLVGRISSSFGHRWGRRHDGIDIAGTYGQPVLAAADGLVTYAGYMGSYGKLVVLRHVGDTESWYGHLSQVAVKPGQRVAAGSIVGRVGSTGHSTGPHLHFEVRVRGRPVDPSPILGLTLSLRDPPIRGGSLTIAGTSPAASRT